MRSINESVLNPAVRRQYLPQLTVCIDAAFNILPRSQDHEVVKPWSFPVCKLKKWEKANSVYIGLWTWHIAVLYRAVLCLNTVLCFCLVVMHIHLSRELCRSLPVRASLDKWRFHLKWRSRAAFVLKSLEWIPPLWAVFHFAANLKFLADTSLWGVHKQSVTNMSCLQF